MLNNILNIHCIIERIDKINLDILSYRIQNSDFNGNIISKRASCSLNIYLLKKGLHNNATVESYEFGRGRDNFWGLWCFFLLIRMDVISRMRLFSVSVRKRTLSKFGFVDYVNSWGRAAHEYQTNCATMNSNDSTVCLLQYISLQ